MSIKNKIVFTQFGLLFSLATLFPAVVQFTHLFESHEHISCSDATEHVHEKKIDCEINDFQITPFDFPNLAIPSSTFSNYYTSVTGCYFSWLSSKKILNFHRRGPPVLS